MDKAYFVGNKGRKNEKKFNKLSEAKMFSRIAQKAGKKVYITTVTYTTAKSTKKRSNNPFGSFKMGW